jgi:8-oxo-dGTP pyrophosphatase MutT (NUDIX family)
MMFEKWEGHQLVMLEKEITGPIPHGVQVAVSVAVLVGHFNPLRMLAYGSLRVDYPVWEFAGGKLEPGEDSRQAAVREIKEELGLDVEIRAHAASVFVARQDKSYVMQFYVAEQKDLQQKVNASEREVKQVEIVDLAKPLGKDDIWWPATRFVWSNLYMAVMDSCKHPNAYCYEGHPSGDEMMRCPDCDHHWVRG